MDSLTDSAWLRHLEASVGAVLADRLLSAMDEPPAVSVRVNPYKLSAPDFGCTISPVEWCPDGVYLSGRPVFTADPLYHAGAYYVQDSSSMFAGYVLRRLLQDFPARHRRVLDLCAAPGGKTTDFAASLRKFHGNDFLLVSNEVMRQRASVLYDNVSLWGDPNVVVTSRDPVFFGKAGSFFDIVLADVPCSGEGMFRKDKGAVADWSEDTVELCRRRQRRIVSDMWPGLRTGGILIYSTCTFEKCENDDNVRWIAENLGAEPLLVDDGIPFDGPVKTGLGWLLLPGCVRGEGQYVSALRKTSGGDRESRTAEKDIMSCSLRSRMAGGRRQDSPDPDDALRYGFADRGEYPLVEVDRMTALRFLHGDSFPLADCPPGYVALTYRGLPLGFVKNLGSRCNNLHPKGRRIIMDINRL